MFYGVLYRMLAKRSWSGSKQTEDEIRMESNVNEGDETGAVWHRLKEARKENIIKDNTKDQLRIQKSTLTFVCAHRR